MNMKKDDEHKKSLVIFKPNALSIGGYGFISGQIHLPQGYEDLRVHVESTQLLSEDPQKTGAKLLNSMRMAMKRNPCMRKLDLPSPEPEDTYYYSSLVMDKVDFQHQYDGSVTFSAPIFRTSHFILCTILLNPANHELFNQQTSELGQRTRKELFDLVNRLNKMRRGSYKKASDRGTELKAIRDINYWFREYRKRAFFKRIQTDKAAHELAHRTFMTLREECQKMMNANQACKQDCPWMASSADDATTALPVHNDISCSSHLCLFSRALLYSMLKKAGIDFYSAANLLNYHLVPPKERGRGIPNEDMVTKCVSLLNEYKVHPLDLFSHASPETVLQHLWKCGSYPSHMSISPFLNDSTRPATDKEIEESVTEMYTGERYHEYNEKRFAGLWLWDQVHLNSDAQKEYHHRLVDQIMKKDWFKEFPFARVLYDKAKKAAEHKSNGPPFSVEKSKIRGLYELTALCIDSGKIRPIADVREEK